MFNQLRLKDETSKERQLPKALKFNLQHSRVLIHIMPIMHVDLVESIQGPLGYCTNA